MEFAQSESLYIYYIICVCVCVCNYKQQSVTGDCHLIKIFAQNQFPPPPPHSFFEAKEVHDSAHVLRGNTVH